ncbi:MAG: ATP-binding protein [Desulfobacterales bacterium]
MDSEIQRLMTVFEAMEDGIYIINQDYTIEVMNRAMVNIFGDGVGKKCYRVLNGYDSRCSWCKATYVFEKGETTQTEKYLPAVDKTYDFTDTPIKNRDGTVSKLTICRDITAQKIREEKLKATEEDYRRLFENVACGVFLSTKEGKFYDANSALQEMLGYQDKEEFLNIDIATDLYLRPEDRQQVLETIEKGGRVVDYEVHFKRKDGTPIPILLTCNARYDSEGHIIGFEGLNVDLTRRKQMEAELKKTQLQLFQAEKLASLGKLAAGVAHQLNNPLGGIILYSKLILEEHHPDEATAEDLHRILRDAERCRDTVKELLAFTHQTRQMMRPQDLNEAISRSLHLIENQSLFHNISIKKELDPSIPSLQADIQQLYHLFTNIVLNAAESMEGKGALTLETRYSADKNQIHIEISDTGPGIPAEDLPQIFDPFFTTKEEGKGTGLGLSLAYSIVENHGGSIMAQNNRDGGATFIINFPLDVPFGDSANG